MAAFTLEWSGRGLVFSGGPPDGPVLRIDGDGVEATSPMQTMLLAIGACTAADVVDILARGRVVPGAFDLQIEGDRVAEPPRRYTRIRLVYRLSGLDAEDEPKVRRAVALSHEKYCSALASLRADVEVESEIVLR